MFVHLNTHSHYSLLEAVPSVSALVEAAAKHAFPALALTDHRYLTGAVEFTLACRKAGIQPLLGMQAEFSSRNASVSLVLLAQDNAGWTNLCRISSAILSQPSPDVPLPLDFLASHSSGLIGIENPAGSLVACAAPLVDILPDRFFVGISSPGELTAEVQRIIKRHRLPMAAFQDVRATHADQVPLLKTMTAIRLSCAYQDIPPAELPPAGCVFANPEEMAFRFQEMPEILSATLEIASRCTFRLPIGKPHLPKFPSPDGVEPLVLLREKAEQGARKYYDSITPAIRARLDGELEVIGRLGFEPVFLIMEELLSYARRENIIFSSRGSAASSLVAHCIGITNPDPLRHNLYFERFLNPARTVPPDIDTDICSRRREEVIQHAFEQYGHDRVAQVGTINRFRPRSALASVAKAYGLTETQVRDLTSSLPYHYWGRGEDDESNQQAPSSPFSDLENRFPRYKSIFKDASALLKLPHHHSVHAGGLVISPGPMTDLVPVMLSGADNNLITQFELGSIEALGLIKLDLLGIRGLTVLGDVSSAIHSWHRREYASGTEVLDSIPFEDREVSDQLEKGLTIGCFQIESPGMRTTLREIKARTVDDIMINLSLYRPGPITGGMKDDFVRRFRGMEKPSYLHPALEPILKETFGVVIYQEQVLRLAHELSGLSLTDSDLLRRAMTHYTTSKELERLKKQFVEGAYSTNRVPPQTAERLWELMIAFTGYGYPKAHAASYAQVSWRSLWCKVHFPAEFMAAVLANGGGYYSPRVYLGECRRLGLTVLPPHINHARQQFSVAYPDGKPVIYAGMDMIRDLTRRTQERIVAYRPFSSLDDLLSRVDPRQQEVENLIRVGALEGFGSIPALLRQAVAGSWQAGQMGLFDALPPAADDEDWTLAQKIDSQQQLMGLSIAAHPLDLYDPAIRQAGAITTAEAPDHIGQRVRVAGTRMTSHRHHNSSGQWMMFLTLEDKVGMLDCVVLPQVFSKFQSLLTSTKPLLVEGALELDKRSEVSLRVEKVVLLE